MKQHSTISQLLIWLKADQVSCIGIWLNKGLDSDYISMKSCYIKERKENVIAQLEAMNEFFRVSEGTVWLTNGAWATVNMNQSDLKYAWTVYQRPPIPQDLIKE